MEENKDMKQEENNNKADELIELKKQIETQKVQIEETEDRLKRVAAEFDNYKKRSIQFFSWRYSFKFLANNRQLRKSCRSRN